MGVHHGGGDEGYGVWDTSWDSFVHALRGVILKGKELGTAKDHVDSNAQSGTFTLLFKNAERIFETLPTLLPPLTRLAELVSPMSRLNTQSSSYIFCPRRT